MCDTTNTWRRAQRSVCIESPSLPPSYMALICESLISTIYDFLNSSTSTAATLSLTSTGVTSLILKSLKRRRSPVSRLCYWSLSYTGHDKSLGQEITACPGSYCAESSLLVITTERHQRINHHQSSTLAESHDAWHLTNNHVIFSFKNTHRVALKNKRCRKSNHSTMSSIPNQTCGCCNCAFLSRISHKSTCSWCRPAPWSSFHKAKPCIYIYIYIYTHTHTHTRRAT